MRILLADLINEPNFSLAQFFDVSLALCRYIEEQHAAGIILERLTPHHIYFDPQQETVELSHLPSGLEQCLSYMSPEQTGRLSQPADARSDLYSLGVILYELLTKRRPFEAEDVLGWSHAHTSLQPKAPQDLSPSIPTVVGEVVLKLLAKNPQERYQSAFSLQADLRRCQVEWERTGTVTPFELGQADSLRRMGTGGPLVGRDKQLAALQEAFQNVCSGQAQIVLIAGYPGTGKTALVEEFRSKVLAAKADFVQGDVDQFRTAAPYNALVQVLRERLRQILAADPSQIAVWQERFRRVLGKDGARIAELVPELELLAGPFETFEYDSAREAEQRFGRTFSDFIREAIGGPETLVVFLDNLQWIDAASCQMVLSLLNNIAGSPLLFIGAYRSNEMDKDHPFLQWAESMRAKGEVSVSTIELDVLTKQETAALISSLVPLEQRGLKLLLEEIYQKSAGNPLHVKQVLQKLNEDGFLIFSSERSCWEYRGEGLKEMALPEDVVDLVRERIQRLPKETVEILKRAACLKQPFALHSLSTILGEPALHVRQAIQPALDEAIIVEWAGGENSNGGSFAFLHDRIREAAYELLSSSERKMVHQQAGRKLLESADGDLSSVLFEAVDHLNESAELLVTEQDRLELARLNLEAASRAMAVIAFQEALRYLAAAVELLPPEHWQKEHQLSYEIYANYYYCTFIIQGFASAEAVFHQLISHAATAQELTDAYELKTILCTGYHTDEEAIKAGITGLKHHGLGLSARPTILHVAWEFLAVTFQILLRPLESLLHQPPMENPWAQKTIALLATLVPPASMVNPQLFVYVILKMNRITLKYGWCDSSAFAFACYPIVAYSVGFNLPKIRKLQEIALQLAERSSPSIRYRTYYVISVFLNYWHRHLRTSLDYARDVHAAAYENGDTLFAGAAVTDLVQIQHALGESLAELAAVNEMALQETTKYGMQFLVDILSAVEVYINCLRGDTLEEYHIPEAVVQRMLVTDSSMIVPYHYLMKIQICYLRGDYRTAYAAVQDIRDKLEALQGKILYIEHIYWACLAYAAVYDGLDPKVKQQTGKLVKRYLKQLAQWSRWNPVNFRHKYTLALAEFRAARLDHKHRMQLYAESVELGEKHGFILDAAVASELAAKYYSFLGLEPEAKTYLKKAYELYTRFGAHAKAKLLVQSPALDGAAAREAEGPERLDRPGKDSESFPAEVSRMADILAVSKVLDSFLISGDSEAAIKQLFAVMVASSGAQRVYLFALDSKARSIKPLAFHEADGSGGFVPETVAVLDELVSRSVVSYAVNTGRPVLVDNAADTSAFSHDRYVLSKNPLSIYCLPIFLENELTGVLYLENNLTVGAFSQEREEFMQKLGALALSWVNLDEAKAAVHVPELDALTEQERRIFHLILQGLSNREIAKQLYLSEGTVKWHTNKIFKKLGVQSRTQAVLKAAEWGLKGVEDEPHE